MVLDKQNLIDVAEAYCKVTGIERESTISHRIFGDTKKLTALRGSADITLSRFMLAFAWFSENWPDGQPVPPALEAYRAQMATPAAPTQNGAAA